MFHGIEWYKREGSLYSDVQFHIAFSTVPAFNSCTKCVGSLGRIHDRHIIVLGMDACMTSQATRFIAMLGGLLDRLFIGVCLGLRTGRRPVDWCRN